MIKHNRLSRSLIKIDAIGCTPPGDTSEKVLTPIKPLLSGDTELRAAAFME
jgi:hypothetical protein